mmetsp:Transcript_38124/g.80749  ORF Transcript_38124/g.80749 Transcript_38124/m.80749 type:complete len:203 (+) Transcript_38124:297-905(+)|eukprot:CAMPEP_0206419430 /NCGR_PEP_ID=MMETSP0324_2-20121206/118_1 /ASSEMBLY_ACC=CAM_ASM_000836 /TAXON_ID=2866 /ORGANISM="Crypthecodinium cohnii, Strain Seligo" /LENGTH=202 /DNA_ID=CAMNT_0053882873 /DNA_START=274 /DNA_END=882 /DNA_ORIENTATION=+
MGCCVSRDKEEGTEQKPVQPTQTRPEPEAETDSVLVAKPPVFGGKLTADREQSLETATSDFEAPAPTAATTTTTTTTTKTEEAPPVPEPLKKSSEIVSMENLPTAATQKSVPELEEPERELTDAASEAKADDVSSQPTTEDKCEEDLDDDDVVGADLDLAVKQAAEELQRKEEERLAAEARARAKAEAEAETAFKGLELSFY